jgi:hypothetical protein
VVGCSAAILVLAVATTGRRSVVSAGRVARMLDTQAASSSAGLRV